jgi:SAM-dependent methyltransferase
VRLAAHAWIFANRLRGKLARARRHPAPEIRRELVRRHAPGKSLADIGCMWKVHGGFSFLAEDAGATRITALDGMDPTPEFLAEHSRRDSIVKFAMGDLHDPVTVERIGVHDVVFCAGVFYHSPNPFQVLQHLRRITGETLLLGGHTLPEVPGLRHAAVFYPLLTDGERAPFRQVYRREGIGIATPFEMAPGEGLAAWWWGITPSAMAAMLRVAGFEVVETIRSSPFTTDFVARPVPGDPVVPDPAEARRRGESGAVMMPGSETNKETERGST